MSGVCAGISARELPALNRAVERITAFFRCIRTRVVLDRALACCADVKEAHVALEGHPYAEQGGVWAMDEFLNRDPPPGRGMFIYAHALREPSLIALLPSTFGLLTSAKKEQIEAAYREAYSCIYQDRGAGVFQQYLAVLFGALTPAVM